MSSTSCLDQINCVGLGKIRTCRIKSRCTGIRLKTGATGRLTTIIHKSYLEADGSENLDSVNQNNSVGQKEGRIQKATERRKTSNSV